MRMIDYQGIPNEQTTDQSATVGSAATLLTGLVTLQALTNFVRISCDNADVRFTISGTTPTATLGRRLPVDGEVVLSRYECDTAKFIRVSTDGLIQVQQYKA